MATRKETAKRKSSLVQEIRRKYRTGVLAPGEMLPSVRTLATRHGLSKRVVNNELHKLAAEGWLSMVPRVGIYVRDRERSQRFLDHSVVVIADVDQPAATHKQTGWTDHVAYGCLREVHRRSLHSIMMHPRRISDEVVERLADEHPYGAVIPEMAIVTEIQDTVRYAEMLSERGVHVVLNGNEPAFVNFHRVSSDHCKGAYELTRWLISQGRRRILPVWSVSPDFYWSRERQAGYEQALKEAGVKPLPLLRMEDVAQRYRPEQRDELIKQFVTRLKPFFRGSSPVDAILTPSDGSVSEVDEAARKIGVRPFEDILICGYDNYWQDLEACGFHWARPAATVDKLNEEVGAEMVRLLLDEAEGALNYESTSNSPVHRQIEPRLVVTSTDDMPRS